MNSFCTAHYCLLLTNSLVSQLVILWLFDAANAETIITADQAVRGGKVSDLKTMVDKAVATSPCVKRVFVASRTGADVPMGENDFPLEKVLTVVYCFSEHSVIIILLNVQTDIIIIVLFLKRSAYGKQWGSVVDPCS